MGIEDPISGLAHERASETRNAGVRLPLTGRYQPFGFASRTHGVSPTGPRKARPDDRRARIPKPRLIFASVKLQDRP
jgi:hypothetical protein